jgi:glutamate decarboxylase
VTIDGHKQMYLPMGTGMLLLRDPSAARFIEKHARYIVRPGSVDLGRRSLEGSRSAGALFLHAALHVIGREGYGLLIDEGMRRAKYLADAVKFRPQFELLALPQLNILVYRYIPEQLRAKARTRDLTRSENLRINQINTRLQKLQRNAGRSFVSRTTLDTTCYGSDTPIVALRAIVANPLTTEADIDLVLNEQALIASNLSRT